MVLMKYNKLCLKSLKLSAQGIYEKGLGDVVSAVCMQRDQGGYKIDGEDTKCELPCTKAK